ncbi:MAG TPA: hypothetical protein VFG87_05975 [Amycolatopsis sp.]|nr:hypothetical protein [Amycolatopsis sp.]
MPRPTFSEVDAAASPALSAADNPENTPCAPTGSLAELMIFLTTDESLNADLATAPMAFEPRVNVAPPSAPPRAPASNEPSVEAQLMPDRSPLSFWMPWMARSIPDIDTAPAAAANNNRRRIAATASSAASMNIGTASGRNTIHCAIS